MIRFYSSFVETEHTLPVEEARHCLRVLRMKPGDIINVTDGKGSVFDCRIATAGREDISLEIISSKKEENPWPAPITLAIAPTKNSDRMEWLVEKSVEIGIDRIVLLECEHSERRHIKTERLEKIMVSAMKQSLKCYLPKLDHMIPIDEFLHRQRSQPEQLFIGYCDASLPRLSFAKSFRPGIPTTIMIGPEGDFSKGEVDTAMKAGFQAVSFGESRLRTETAALFALAGTHLLSQALL